MINPFYANTAARITVRTYPVYIKLSGVSVTDEKSIMEEDCTVIPSRVAIFRPNNMFQRLLHVSLPPLAGSGYPPLAKYDAWVNSSIKASGSLSKPCNTPYEDKSISPTVIIN
jgi:hypothetical protein